MSIELAEKAGFCFGVNRAVNMAYDIAEKKENVYMYGPIIHNPQIITELKNKGMTILDKIPLDIAKLNNRDIIIRAHGITREDNEAFKNCGAQVYDATCPYVKKIHNIVSKADSENAVVFIIGNASHPEVIGINSYAGNAYIFDDYEKLKEFTENNPELRGKYINMVAQTTLNISNWEKCCKYAKKVYTNIKIFDTICSATEQRQTFAKELAEKSDLMVVIGGRESSNTVKLFEICSSICKNCVHIQEKSELYAPLILNMIKDAKSIGVTAGASTPLYTIKEVINIMEDIKNQNVDVEEFDFATALEGTLKSLNTGDKVSGIVVAITPNEVQVDLGTKQAGSIPYSQLTSKVNYDVNDIVKVGDEIEAVVLRVNDVEGIITLSLKKIEAIKGWEEIQKAYEDKEAVDGVVVGVNKGGLEVMVKGTKIFVPASQASLRRDENLDEMIRQPVKLKITELGRGNRRRPIGSIRAVLADQKKELAEKFWADAEVGKRYNGVVKSLTSYGAFVDLGGVDGMVHISELSWTKIKHPSEVVKVGDSVDVYIKDIDTENQKISLGFKNVDENPWEIFKNKYNEGDSVKVKIVNFMPFGAFAQILPGVDGLIHISQISNKRIANPQDVLKIGEEVDAKILEVDFDAKKVSLSIRALIEEQIAAEAVDSDAETTEEVKAETEAE